MLSGVCTKLGFISCNCPVCGHMSCPNKLEKCVCVCVYVCMSVLRHVNSFVHLIVVFSVCLALFYVYFLSIMLLKLYRMVLYL